MKRTQKGCEDEPTVGGPAAVNGISSEILYLLDPAQGLLMPEGNTSFGVNGERFEEPRSRRPIRTTHDDNQATSEALKVLDRPLITIQDRPSMPDKWNKQGRQMTIRESDGCIVPTKPEGQSGGENPGNAGVGKAARPTRD